MMQAKSEEDCEANDDRTLTTLEDVKNKYCLTPSFLGIDKMMATQVITESHPCSPRPNRRANAVQPPCNHPGDAQDVRGPPQLQDARGP
jgi:hypothetical protein